MSDAASDRLWNSTELTGLSDEIYSELILLAHRELRRLPTQLDATEVLHIAWVSLRERLGSLERGALTALFSVAMRRVLIDESRRRATLRAVDASEAMLVEANGSGAELVDLLALEAALEALHQVDERWATIVRLRYFGGATEHDIAVELGLSRKTVVRDWKLARAWLRRRLCGAWAQ